LYAVIAERELEQRAIDVADVLTVVTGVLKKHDRQRREAAQGVEFADSNFSGRRRAHLFGFLPRTQVWRLFHSCINKMLQVQSQPRIKGEHTSAPAVPGSRCGVPVWGDFVTGLACRH